MNKPKNLNELTEYLQANPNVWNEDRNERRELAFVTLKSGGLWFVDLNGKEVYLPINCGLTPAETGVEFFDDRFEFTKFGITLKYFYA